MKKIISESDWVKLNVGAKLEYQKRNSKDNAACAMLLIFIVITFRCCYNVTTQYIHTI